MSSENNQNNSERDEASRSSEESSSSQVPSSGDIIKSTKTVSACDQTITVSPTSESDEMKRAIAKKLIERYFYQLSDGCGKPNCANKNCASSGSVEALSPNQAAARAIQLYSQEAELCEIHPAKVAKTQDCKSNVDDGSGTKQQRQRRGRDLPHSSNSSQNYSSEPNEIQNASCIDEQILNKLMDKCKLSKSYAPLIRKLGTCFSSRESIARSFQKRPSAHIDAILEKAPRDLKNLKKEDFRTLEGDLDKDEDSSDDSDKPQEPHYTTIDFVSLCRAMQRLYEESSATFDTLNASIHTLSTSLSIDLRFITDQDQINDIISVFLIIFEVLVIGSTEFMDIAMPSVIKAATHLPIWAQARLASIWAKHRPCLLKPLLESVQQLVSVHVVAGMGCEGVFIQTNDTLIAATKIMKIIYYASMMAGTLDSQKFREEEIDSFPISGLDDESYLYSYISKPKMQSVEDALGKELDINVLDCRQPYVPFEDFYNEPLSDSIAMDHDYLNYKSRKFESDFSYMLYSFILTPATKTLALYYDSRIRMYSERYNMYNTIHGELPNPYLNLKVRRDHIIDDALVELELIAMGNPKDLKKQLVVEFVGEQGIDEGGVSKEFFQMVVEQIFNPDFGMFINQEDNRNMWFNSTSFENEAQFTLIGIVLGLAIYNNIILAVNFPMVVYRKLMGCKGSFADLEDWNPTLSKGLQSMLNYEDSDMEEVFSQTFQICYMDVFGNVITHNLKENGSEILVNQDNKQEFVDLYTDYLLNTSVEKQFKAFKKGFQMVTDESPLHLLFRPEEVELLVCGSKKFDFDELEKATEYEGGYTDKSRIIKEFWEIVHGLSTDLKKKLLEFTTGSDRVPVGGFSKLKLIVARNGPDSDRLPTSHTCFNVLLLPEYTDKQKLEDRLLKAISYSKGFGML